MRGRRGLLGLVMMVALAVLLVASSSAAAQEAITATCTYGGQTAPCTNGWYTTAVSMFWDASPKPVSPSSPCALEVEHDYATDAITTLSCTVIWPDMSSLTSSFSLHVEASPLIASANVARAPDSNGWYNHPVGVSFEAKPLISGVPSCTPSITYPVGSLTGTCTDPAGKTASTSIALNYDATPPTMAGVIPARPPDHNGWYNHPVAFAFGGTDATSGISSCSRATYSGPNSAAASLAGSCTDRAGNVAVMSVPFHYDASPPALDVSANPGDGVVSLDLRTTGDVAPTASLKVMRTPGLKGSGPSKVYGGEGGRFRDRDVRNGVKYRYTITAVDRAGNEASRTITSIPGPRLLSPRRGARLVRPPLLSWTPVTHAMYYNVQLYRGRTKVMSVWPKRASLQLTRTWRFKGHRYGLRSAHYTWYVWPGFGPRSAGRYGKPVGTGTFVVTPKI